jgi:glycosyl transferase family 25
MEKVKLTWQFLDAVDGRLINFPIKEYPEKKVKKLLGFGLMAGEIGAFLSHKIAWKICLESSHTTLVLEDDFVFLPHFEDSIKFMMDTFTTWEMVRFQALDISQPTKLYQHGTYSVVHNTSDPLGCTAYLIKPSAANKLLRQADTIYEPIDHFLEHEKKHGVRFLALQPYPITVSGAPTTVINRPERQSLRGLSKIRRSLFRLIDRISSSNPWFPK